MGLRARKIILNVEVKKTQLVYVRTEGSRD